MLCSYFKAIFEHQTDPRIACPELFGPSTLLYNGTPKRLKGFQGEIAPKSGAVPGRRRGRPNNVPQTAQLLEYRAKSTSSSPSGSPGSQVPQSAPAAVTEPFQMRFSLAEIASGTHLRVDDVAFALIHSGLAMYRAPPPTLARAHSVNKSIIIADDDLELVIAPGLVEDVTRRFNIKPAIISKAHSLL